MKTAIMAEGPDQSARIGLKFSTASHIFILDDENGKVEARENPGASAQKGRGIQTLVFLLSRNIKRVIVEYCNPAICKQLEDNGIEALTGYKGCVEEIITKLKHGSLTLKQNSERAPAKPIFSKRILFEALKKTVRQFVALLPVLLGVVFLLGIVQAYLTKEIISSIFSGNPLFDTLWAAVIGSAVAGNPINSYVIGGELLNYGVSLFAVTAFILAWVTVGIAQLPAEIAALGRKFALIRNGLAFLIAIPTAIITVLIFNLAG
jgi:predicted Fe-Mo cluster-binding NifX family protein